MFFRFLKQIFHFGLERLNVDGKSKEMALWSDTSRSHTCRLVRGAEFVMTRSKVCPLVCGDINKLF